MKLRWLFTLVIGGACASLSSCVSLETSVPLPETLGMKSVSASCVAGRNIYLTNCTQCHSPEAVRDYSREEWESEILPVMCKKSKLTPDEAAAVRSYVFAVLSSPPKPPAS